MGNRLSRKKKGPTEPRTLEEDHGYECTCEYCCPLKRRLPPHDPYDSYDTRLNMKGIRIEMKPTTFKISTDPDKPSKFTFTNNQPVEQDVFVTCFSQIFAIQNPTGQSGLQSQYFVQLKPNESLNVEIGLRDAKDIPPFPADFDLGGKLLSAAGYGEIAHYPHGRENPYKLDGVYRYDKNRGEYYGLWRDYLVPDKETEWVKEKCEEYRENVLNWIIAKGDEEDLEENQKSGKGKAPPKKEEPPKKSVKSEIKKSVKKEVVSSKKEEPKEKENSAGKKSKKSKSSEVKNVEKGENSKSNIIV